MPAQCSQACKYVAHAPAHVIMGSMALTRRSQLLLDDEVHARLRESAARRGISMGALIREAIEEKLSHSEDTRVQAIEELLAAEPLAVGEWPEMKHQMIDDINAPHPRA
jgi:plasmid stability protein